ncbi:protein naked cuticle homolog 1-like isoform X2 [Liolophura sinensis]|uniref:protein naked cuticle homolog 1-like isoform X2 n=1 Tax=Liolophura sinensis TaxID=3198878 RepID=UPI00315862C4
MMGKLQSKQVECFLVDKSLEDQILKSKSECNLANFNMESSVSEVSICCDGKQERIPLKVELPPEALGNDTIRVLTIDRDGQVNCQEKCSDHERSLNIEEFECGVQIESRESSKQEWSFTLYDFDGQGKITKEDLASLLKALYDAVGSSIKLPSSGTKSLKLRLTVGPDNSQLQADIKADVKSSPVKNSKGKDSPVNKDSSLANATDNGQTIHLPKDLSKLNNLLQQSSRHQHTPKCNIEKQQQQQAQQQQQQQAQQQQQTRHHQQQSGHQPSTLQTLHGNRVRLSSHDHQHLAELVQQNMERNHVRHLRRHHSDSRGSSQHEHSHQKRKHKPVCQNNQTEERPKESQDRRNYYLDLAGVENNTSKFQPTSSELNHAQENQQSPQRGRSQDAACKFHDNLKKEGESTKVTSTKLFDNVRFDPHVRSRSFDPQEATQRSPKSQTKVSSSPMSKYSRYRPVSLPSQVPDSVSPHYHRRHRHREKDHDLAMQQVAEWIERQHTWDEDGKRLVIQRHEHHHVHEHHHHHHYHHYYEA